MSSDSRKEHIITGDTSRITDDKFEQVVNLARLDPLQSGMGLHKAHLKSVVDHFKVLSQVDPGETEPVIHVNPAIHSLRDDEAIDTLDHDEALSSARLRSGEYFQAPKILGGTEADG